MSLVKALLRVRVRGERTVESRLRFVLPFVGRYWGLESWRHRASVEGFENLTR